jgi:rhamnosyltransferase subunit B
LQANNAKTMKVLISTFGSHGDVLPFAALARKFASHGHEVIVYTNPYFRHHAESPGVRFVPIGTVEQYVTLFAQLSDSDPVRAFRRMAAEYVVLCPDYYQAMRQDVVAGQTIAIGNTLLFAHRALRETDQVPCATVHLAPSVFRSNIRSPRLTPASDRLGPHTPDWLKNSVWWLLDKAFYDPVLTQLLNRYRAELGLPNVERMFRSWIHEADCVVGLFPEWFAEPQPDWPADVVLAGFPLHDQKGDRPLVARLQAFLDAGPAPIAFSAGTAKATAHAFFHVSVQAAQQAGVRAILLTHFEQQVPAVLPDSVIHVDYARFSALLPRLAAFVHHGGIGSTSEALRAGVPQLIRPTAYDQFDNSALAVKLGVARELLGKQYTAPAVAHVLKEMLVDSSLRQSSRRVADLFKRNEDPFEIAYNAICQRCFSHGESLVES